MTSRFPKSLLLVPVLLALACGPQAPSGDSNSEVSPTPSSPYASTPLSVFTTNYPLAYFAERIGGDLVEPVGRLEDVTVDIDDTHPGSSDLWTRNSTPRPQRA